MVSCESTRHSVCKRGHATVSPGSVSHRHSNQRVAFAFPHSSGWIMLGRPLDTFLGRFHRSWEET
jgi:hypothetical protein